MKNLCNKCGKPFPTEQVWCNWCDSPSEESTITNNIADTQQEFKKNLSPEDKRVALKKEAATFVKVGIGSILIPLFVSLFSLAIANLIPGCSCDEGSGCSGCGPNALLANTLFGGFIAALIMGATILPVCLIWGAVCSIRSDHVK